MNIHAIIIALNEEDFITETIKPLYNYCSGISIITQYDRDYYGKMVTPDATVEKVLSYPDPEGKIHLVVRRYNDETASRNHEMKAMMYDASKGIIPHGVPLEKIQQFHATPDYFLICDADEIYDINTIGAVVDYLKVKKPRGMRVSAYDYFGNWNRRLPREKYVHHHFGFVKAGILFEQRRVISWNEFRLNKFVKRFGINAKIGTILHGFIDCPWEVGMLHHAGYIRKNKEKYAEKMSKHSHPEAHADSFLDSRFNWDFEFVEMDKLPENIQNGNWPENFFEKK
jgi:hypothetical protein